MSAYYNEFDPNAAAWLRELIKQGLIAPGDVDTRSIKEVNPDDLKAYTQCHFFAGIGGWSYALRLAGWPDDRPVWTGSCPCQPFSAAGAGKQAGFNDERHLWPTFLGLIQERRPSIVFGEQVASKDGLNWLDLVQADLEASNYAVGAADLCAAGVGAPHIRQRLWFVGLGDADDARLEGRREVRARPEEGQQPFGSALCRRIGRLADADEEQRGWRPAHDRIIDGAASERHQGDGELAGGGGLGWLADGGMEESESIRGDGAIQPIQRYSLSGAVDADGVCGLGDPFNQPRKRGTGSLFGAEAQKYGERVAVDGRLPERPEHAGESMGAAPTGPTNGLWRDADWLFCRDGKWRPVEPGTFPLAHGLPARVGRLRGYGNAIVPQVAEVFIRTVMEHQHDLP